MEIPHTTMCGLKKVPPPRGVSGVLEPKSQKRAGRPLTRDPARTAYTRSSSSSGWAACVAGFLQGVKLMPKEPPDDLVTRDKRPGDALKVFRPVFIRPRPRRYFTWIRVSLGPF